MPISNVGGPGPTGDNPVSDAAHEHVATVRHGETVSDVAQRHGVEMRSLLEANPQLKDGYQKLNAGQEIRLPQVTASADAATPKLYEAASKGKHIPEVTIEMARGNTPAPLGDPTTKAVIQGQLSTTQLSEADLAQVQGGVQALSRKAGGDASKEILVQKEVKDSHDRYANAPQTGTTVQEHEADRLRHAGEVLMEAPSLSTADLAQVRGGVKGESTADKHKDESPAELPTEAVSFNFGKIVPTYTPQKTDGTLDLEITGTNTTIAQKRLDGGGGGNVTANWDLEKAKGA